MTLPIFTSSPAFWLTSTARRWGRGGRYWEFCTATATAHPDPEFGREKQAMTLL